MVKNNLLLIAYYFAPYRVVGAKRFSYFSNCLEKDNYNIHVITIKDRYIKEKDLSMPRGGKIHKTKVIPFYPRERKNKINKIINKIIARFFPIDQYLGWILPAVIKGLSIIRENNINEIIVTGPPFSSFFIGYFLSLLSGKDLVVDYQDPWHLYSKPGLKSKIYWCLEKKIMNRAKAIILNTEKAREGYIKKIESIKSKSYVIPNPFIEVGNVEPSFLGEKKKVITYTGNFYGKRRLNYIIEPLKKIFSNSLLSSDEISIHVFGEILKEDLEEFEKNNLSHILTEHKKVDFNILLSYLKGSDVLLLSQGDDHKYSVPYKLTDYLSIKRPILAITSKDSATYDVLRVTNCGIAADINDSNSIYNALKIILIDKKEFSFDGIATYSLQFLKDELYKVISKRN